jgi:hypothetical protein
MLLFLIQAITPVNSLLSRLKKWKYLCKKLAERPRKRLMKMEELLLECYNS